MRHPFARVSVSYREAHLVRQPADRDQQASNPFPIAPADVPAAAVQAVKRTLLRNDHRGIEDPMDDELAQLVVAVVIAALHEGKQESRRRPSRRRQDEPTGTTALF